MFRYLTSFLWEDPNENTQDKIQYSFLSSDEVFYVEVKECNPKIQDVKALIQDKEKLSEGAIDIVSKLNYIVLEDEDTISNKSDILKIVKHPDTRTVPPSMIISIPDIVLKDKTEDGVLLACGCAMTPELLFGYIKVELERGEKILTCFQCRKEWEFKDACNKAQMSADEKLLFGLKISLNSVGDVCPSCKYYCQRKDNDRELWMKCTRRDCSFEFCWNCRQKWSDSHNVNKCNSANIQKILRECPKKVMGYSKIENVPSIRLCPNCNAFIEHAGGCKETKCTKCKKSFCFVCLTMCKGNDCYKPELQCSKYASKCTVAPVQTV